MKKRVMITSLAILLLGSAAAVAQSIRSNDASGPEVKLTLTPSSDCYAGSTPQSYCQYQSAPGAAVVDSVAYYNAQVNSVDPMPGTLGSGWVSGGVVIVDFNANTTPIAAWPAQIQADVTFNSSGPAPTPSASQYAFTASLPSSSNLRTSNGNTKLKSDDSSNYSAAFVVTTDNKTQISLTDSNFQPGKAEYICQQWSPTKTLVLSSTPCTSLPQPGLLPTLLNTSVLEYPAHPAMGQPVVINAYSANNVVISSSTAFELTQATSVGTTTVTFNASGATALFRLQPVDANLGANAPTLSLTMQSGQTLQMTLPYSTTLTAYNILSVDSTAQQALTASPSQIQQNVTTVNLVNATMPNLRVKNWPSYMAMGTLTDLSQHSIDLLVGTTATPARQTDAIFKYAGNDGAGDANHVYDPDTFTDRTIALAKNIQTSTGHDVNPVMVIYTVNFSGGNEAFAHADLDLTTDNQPDPTRAFVTAANENTPPWNFDIASDSDNPATNPPCAHTTFVPDPTPDNPNHKKPIGQDTLCMHYYNLISIASQMQAQPLTSVKDGSKFWGTIILNPDFIGTLHQLDINQKAPVSPMMDAKSIPIANSLALAVNAYEKQHNITTPHVIPTDLTNSGTMVQYIESLNWIVKSFAPNVTFGWQDNVWAGQDHNWLHTAVSDPSQVSAHVNSEAKFLQTLDVYSDTNGNRATYAPDFIAFDKYEHDDETNGVLSYAPYYYEAPVWDVYLSYVGGVSRALNNVPVMLWQIPGGHLRTANDLDTRKQASTSADYFVGDPQLQPGLTNLASDLKQLLGTMNSVTFFGSPGNTSLTLFQSSSICAPNQLFASAIVDCENGVLNWQQGHLYNALHSNVFAILWGGGQTTGIVGNDNVGGLNLDDNGWLAGRLKDYYANPIQLPDGN